MGGIDQDGFQLVGLQHEEQLLPIEAGTLHRYRAYAVGFQPLAQLVKVFGISLELLDVFLRFTDADPVAVAAHVDAAGVGG